MNYGGVLYLLGRLLLGIAGALLVPAFVGWVDGRGAAVFFGSAAAVGAAGLTFERLFVQQEGFRFGRREAFLLVSLAWVVATVAGAIPYVAIKGPWFVVNALFESASGFTTTGASVFPDIESEPRALVLWRSLTQWLGGMGIIVLGIAILPKLAVGGMELLEAEATGVVTEKLTPRISQTAKALWGIYALLTGAEVAVLCGLGMSPFEAVNHSFTTLATGGFSTRNSSVAAYDSPMIEWVITAFMLLGGVNFALHFQFLRGRVRKVLRDPELRAYVAIFSATVFLIALELWARDLASWVDAPRLAAFQVATMLTTTGFATADYELWPAFSQALLFVLMFVGACAGSTSGSVKVVRIVIVAKKLLVDLKRVVQPHAVLPVRMGPKAIPEDVVASVTTFLILYLALFACGGLSLTVLGVDMMTAFSAVATCMGNIGPGFGLVGPTETFVGLPAAGKLVLAVLMIVGRLELYTFLIAVFLLRRM
jgi:trk system potassium uptake protein TrkH